MAVGDRGVLLDPQGEALCDRSVGAVLDLLGAGSVGVGGVGDYAAGVEVALSEHVAAGVDPALGNVEFPVVVGVAADQCQGNGAGGVGIGDHHAADRRIAGVGDDDSGV